MRSDKRHDPAGHDLAALTGGPGAKEAIAPDVADLVTVATTPPERGRRGPQPPVGRGDGQVRMTTDFWSV